MSSTESGANDGHGHLRDLAGRLHPHHRDVADEPGLGGGRDDELARDAGLAGYDLAADLAHPVPRPHEVAGFDLDTDIGLDNEPLDGRG
ncbi:hypothetical protein GCM10023322_43090 [Rugosimonospora acidiphila]|uniref:Uncharacterized protein n=1 Tax=Rugosimonospora acidiphila TaxID=556531 RepID=A0ABP9S022_9ACTN